jgi:hypothetical protein
MKWRFGSQKIEKNSERSDATATVPTGKSILAPAKLI